MLRLGFLANGEMLGWESEKLCAFIRESGYDCVELIDDIIFSPDKPECYIKGLLKAAAENNVQISEILVQHDLVMKD